MILPAMGVVSELITAFARKRVFGYKFVAYSSLAIASIGFLVWGHHMFVSGQSMYAGLLFSFMSFAVAVPSAIKVYNWTATGRLPVPARRTPVEGLGMYWHLVDIVWVFLYPVLYLV
jgi:cytochrome c oxidase subunit I